MLRFVLIAQTARASSNFSLEDLPSSSGRWDVLLRVIRAALLVSNGLRQDVILYLVLCGGPEASRVLRIDGSRAKFVRPDERSLAILLQKTLAAARAAPSPSFQELRPGISCCTGDLEQVLSELGDAPRYLLTEDGSDVRAAELPLDAAFFVGDQLGFEPRAFDRLAPTCRARLAVGPVSLHSEDVVTLLLNELDRRRAPTLAPS